MGSVMLLQQVFLKEGRRSLLIKVFPMLSSISIWNVKGLNSSIKQKEVDLLSQKNSCGLLALLETKLNKEALQLCHSKIFPHWRSLYNGISHSKCRIWVIWKADEFDICLLGRTDQYIHLRVQMKATLQQFFLTIVYASNAAAERLVLWDDLRNLTTHDAWLVGGDFNNVLRPDEREGGQHPLESEFAPFADFLGDCSLEDMRGRGRFFTWTNNTIRSKIDRV